MNGRVVVSRRLSRTIGSAVACFALLALMIGPAVAATTGPQIPRVEEAPGFDGVLDDPVWKVAAQVELEYKVISSRNPQEVPPAEKTQAFIARDERYLYVAFICHESNPGGMKQSVREYDGPVNIDDSVEIFVDPGSRAPNTYYQFFVSSAGVKKDQRIQHGSADTAWDSGFIAATQMGQSGWTVEVGIPFYTMDIDMRATDAWRMNLCRNLMSREPGQWLSWAEIDNYHTPEEFIHVGGLEDVGARRVFAPVIREARIVQWGYDMGRPIYSAEVRISNPGGRAGEAELCLTDRPLNGAASETAMQVHVAARGETRAVVRTRVPLAARRSATVRLQTPETGRIISGSRAAGGVEHLSFMGLFATQEDYSTNIPDIQQTVALGEATERPEAYGAEANPNGAPVGGGEGYDRLLDGGDYRVGTRQELLAALEQAEAGEVVYVESRAEIDLSDLARIAVPAGVTLAGNRGHEGAAGPLLYSNRMPGEGFPILFDLAGDRARLTGLRIRGPDPDYAAQRAGPSTLNRGVNVGANGEVDNCEVSNFYREGIAARGPGVHIHHNDIHDVGAYPVLVTSRDALIESNLIRWGWHAIACTGSVGTSYEACYNHFRPHDVESIGQCLDMHPDRRGLFASRAQFIAGDYVTWHHNTLELRDALGMRIRGTPRLLSRVYGNWFLTEDSSQALGPHGSGGETPTANVWVYDNVYGADRRHIAQLAWHTKPYILFKTPEPPQVECERVSGSLPLEIEVSVFEGLELKGVLVELDDKPIYVGSKAPEAGTVVINTTELANGVHVIRVSAIDNRNVLGAQEVLIEVAN